MRSRMRPFLVASGSIEIVTARSSPNTAAASDHIVWAHDIGKIGMDWANTQQITSEKSSAAGSNAR